MSGDPAEPKADHDDCDHEWELVDESFDHEYGTESVVFWRCAKCDKEKEAESSDFDHPDDFLS